MEAYMRYFQSKSSKKVFPVSSRTFLAEKPLCVPYNYATLRIIIKLMYKIKSPHTKGAGKSKP